MKQSEVLQSDIEAETGFLNISFKRFLGFSTFLDSAFERTMGTQVLPSSVFERPKGS